MSNVYDNDDYHDGDDGDHDDDGQQGPGLGLSPSPICPIKGLAASVQSQPRVAKMMIVMIIITWIDVQEHFKCNYSSSQNILIKL